MAIVFVTVAGVALSKNKRRFPDVRATIVSARAKTTQPSANRIDRNVIFFIRMPLADCAATPIELAMIFLARKLQVHAARVERCPVDRRRACHSLERRRGIGFVTGAFSARLSVCDVRWRARCARKYFAAGCDLYAFEF